jgi:hypothetical protein
MHARKLTAVLAAVVPLGLAAPVAVAAADTAPAAPPPASAPPSGPLLTFVPPRVGPLVVAIGPIFLQGKLVSPGVNVATPGVSAPPIVWSPPAVPAAQG